LKHPAQLSVAESTYFLDKTASNQAIAAQADRMDIEQPSRGDSALVLDANSVNLRPQDLSFESRDGTKVVTCGISRDALADLGSYHRLNGADDEVFRALRPEIERLANAKYRAGRLDDNGAVVIGPADILLYGFESAR
jgi:hypothetical protein